MRHNRRRPDAPARYEEVVVGTCAPADGCTGEQEPPPPTAGWLAKPGPAGAAQRGLLQVELRHDPAGSTWRSERVDLCARYRARYGDPVEERIRYIGVVTDADSSGSVAEADYDEIVLEGR